MRQAKFNRNRSASSKRTLIVKKPSTGSRQYSDSKPFGVKKSSADSRPYSDSKPYEVRKPSINSSNLRPNPDSKPFGNRKPAADSRPFSDSKSHSKSFGIKKPSTGSRSHADSKPFVVKKSSSDEKVFSGPKAFASKNPTIGSKPFATKKPRAVKKTFTSTDAKPFTDIDADDIDADIELKKPKAEKKPKPPKKLDPEKCAKCLKLHALCICPEIRALETDLHVLILQHPQEPDEDLGSARLAHLSLKNSTLKTGLSWANLSKALGREAQPAKWTVLHLGSGIKGAPTTSNLQFVSKQGTPVDPPKGGLEGIVVLDGTWSQSKALWWRNPWLLKLKRSILIPQEKSLYRELRKEPRQECLSTIESIAETLDALGEPDEIKVQLNTVFKSLLGKYRDLKKCEHSLRPKKTGTS